MIMQSTAATAVKVATWSELDDRSPAYALVANVDLVVIRYDDQVSVLYGRCLHRGALLSDGHVRGDDLICGVHNWDYRYDTGVSSYNPEEALHKFGAWIDADADAVFVDAAEVAAWHDRFPQAYRRDEYLGLYADVHGTPEEPHNHYIQELARNGLEKVGHHGVVTAMGVPLTELPRWSDIQLLTAQLATRPLADDAAVGTELVIGPRAQRPLRLQIPLFVSDMSFGALSEEAKTALAKGAEMAGTGICSGEGGMLPEEQANNSRYFYELASAKFGWSMDKACRSQAFHFKGGQGAKTGTGGHLPGTKVIGKIAQVRGLDPGTPAISPSRFPDLVTPEDFREIAEAVRERTGGIPIGFKMSAQRTAGIANHDKTLRKFNRDCTICVSCCWTGPCWTVPRKRESRALMAGILPGKFLATGGPGGEPRPRRESYCMRVFAPLCGTGMSHYAHRPPRLRGVDREETEAAAVTRNASAGKVGVGSQS